MMHWDLELGRELERMAVVEELKNEGVTPGQLPAFLAHAAPQVADEPGVLTGAPLSAIPRRDAHRRQNRMEPILSSFKAKTDLGLIPPMIQANADRSSGEQVGAGVPAKLDLEGSLLDSCVLADMRDQGASADHLVEILRGGQYALQGRELAEEWASMPQSDTRRSSHHKPDGSSAWESGRGFAGTPECQWDSRRHAGMSAPFMHHLLFGTMKSKEDTSVAEQTFFQLENTPWTEAADPESGAAAGGPGAPLGEQIGHALDAAMYFGTLKSKNIGPHGKSPLTDPEHGYLLGEEPPLDVVINDHFAH